MITVTKNARHELRSMLRSQNLKSGHFLRLTTAPVWTGEGDFGIVVDEERPGDIKIIEEDTTLILVDQDLGKELSKAVMGFNDTIKDQRFTLDVY